ncbi:MAG: hypothetical protein [Caudoviricetes sp.]|nr:MAG: hypothetical protein [Caudoviricetes sp.]
MNGYSKKETGVSLSAGCLTGLPMRRWLRNLAYPSGRPNESYTRRRTGCSTINKMARKRPVGDIAHGLSLCENIPIGGHGNSAARLPCQQAFPRPLILFMGGQYGQQG